MRPKNHKTIPTPTEFFPCRKGRLHAEGVTLEKIAQKAGTPVYVYSSAALLRQLATFERGLAGFEHLIAFAVKSNPSLALLRLLAKAGAGADIVSGGELFRARKAGVAPGRIVFSGVGKTREELLAGLDAKIRCFNIESLDELETLNDLALRRGLRAPIAFRFTPEVAAGGHSHIRTGRREDKFGLLREEILEIVAHLPAFRGVRLEGLSVHIGSQIMELTAMDRAFARARALAIEITRATRQPLTAMDLGGGLGVPYSAREARKAPSLESYCRLIQKHFRQADPRLWKGSRPFLVIEPGRAISANSGILLTQVVRRKSRPGQDGIQFAIIDAGMNDLLRPALYGSRHEIMPVRHAGREDTSPMTVVGPVCESSDCFGSGIALPSKLRAGDLLAILSAGAYGDSMSSTYNSRPRPAEVLVSGNRFDITRKREKLSDLAR